MRPHYSILGKTVVVVLFGIAGWATCAVITMISARYLSDEGTLVAHTIGTPATFAVLSAIYFGRFGFTTPLHTGVIFAGIVFGIEACLVAPLFVGSYAMFSNALLTWIPMALIFAATYLTGLAAVGPGSGQRRA